LTAAEADKAVIRRITSIYSPSYLAKLIIGVVIALMSSILFLAIV